MSRMQPMGEELANCLVSLRPTHPGLAWSIFGIEWGAVTAISPARSATSSAFSGM